MWKPWEIEKTKNVYPSGEDEGVQALLPHVTANGRAALLCIKKAQQKANIVDMSIEERSKYILANIDTKTLDELAEDLTEYNIRLIEIKKRVSEVQDNMREEYLSQVENLDNMRNLHAVKYGKIKKSSGDVWDALKAATEEAWSELEFY